MWDEIRNLRLFQGSVRGICEIVALAKKLLGCRAGWSLHDASCAGSGSVCIQVSAAVDGEVQAAVISHVVWTIFVFSAVYGLPHSVDVYDYVTITISISPVYWYLFGGSIILGIGVYGVEVYGVSQVGSYLAYPSSGWL